MTWQTARADAAQLVARMLASIRAAEAGPDHVEGVLLVEYRDLEAYQFFAANPEWPWKHHLAVVRAAARELRKHGLKVRIVPLGLVDYLDWLARFDLLNTPENRAQFISWTTAPEPKPQPR